jgi:hypothetical protein
MKEFFGHGIIMGYAEPFEFAYNQSAPSGLQTPVPQTLAGVAQLVEQRIRNAKVGCSIHLTGTTAVFKLVQTRLLWVIKPTGWLGKRRFNRHRHRILVLGEILRRKYSQ